MVFYWGKTLGYLWSLRLLVTGWTKWLKIWAFRPEFLEFFSLQNPIPLRKAQTTAVFDKSCDLFPSFDHQSTQNFFSTKPTYVRPKKISSQIAFFWPILKPDMYQTKAYFNKVVYQLCCKLFQNFKSFIRSPFGCHWIDFYFLAWKCTQISAFCSSGARTKADLTKCRHDLESSSYALQSEI